MDKPKPIYLAYCYLNSAENEGQALMWYGRARSSILQCTFSNLLGLIA